MTGWVTKDKQVLLNDRWTENSTKWVSEDDRTIKRQRDKLDTRIKLHKIHREGFWKYFEQTFIQLCDGIDKTKKNEWSTYSITRIVIGIQIMSIE